MTTRFLCTLLIGTMLFSCKKDKDADTDTDADADADADADTDTDADADADSDADADTDADTDADCQDEDAAAAPVSITGTTVGESDDFFGSCEGTSGDYAVAFTPPAAGLFVFDLAGSSFDTTLAVFDGCAGNELDCNDDALPGLISQVVLNLDANQTAIAVVGGFGAGEGDFVLNIAEAEANETDCTDGRDLDGDFLVDCEDDDCDIDAACIETCDDGIDNNGDFEIDCLDTDCAADAGCLGACPELNILGALPAQLLSSTTGESSNDNGACGGLGAPDITADFTAPTTGRFVFELDEAGTTFDAILDVRTDCAASTVLNCADVPGNGGEQVVVDLNVGDTVVVSVDGFDGEDGDFQLDVREIPATELSCVDQADDDLDGLFDCLDDDCLAEPLCVQACPASVADTVLPTSVAGSLIGLTDISDPTCGLPVGFIGSSTTFEFVAPADGDYAFGADPTVTEFDAALAFFDTCGGAELACADIVTPNGGEVAILPMTAGQSVIVVVDAWFGTGNYEIDIVVPVAAEIDCADGLDEDADGLWDCADDDCAAEIQCIEVCDDGIDQDLDGLIDCADDDCATEIQCIEVCDDLIDQDFDGLLDCADDDCAADPLCAVVCPVDTLLGALPITATGSTLGVTNANALSCGGDIASDTTYEFTAPADGVYTFSTDGSDYDTVLAVLDGCAGVELGCNDDTAGLTSEVTVTLTVGDVVIVVVDGFGQDSGDYTLTVQ